MTVASPSAGRDRPAAGRGPNVPVVLAARDVSFSYGRDLVLAGVDLEVRSGEFVALVGPNGSGKSTLLRLLLGLTEPQGGDVELFGGRPGRLRERWRLGYVPQRPVVADELPATVEEVVAAGCLSRRGWRRGLTVSDRDDITHALDSVALLARRRDRFSELSGGQQQRVLIAKALVFRPELLILDEPVAGGGVDAPRRGRDARGHHVDEQAA
ncbi:MAG: metal ABC transporter ATP-binding protein, partial [Acidimicrobiia bacterium]